MSVIAHPTKNKKEPGRWWYVVIGYGKNRTYIPFEGTFDAAVAYERTIRQTAAKSEPIHAAPRIKELVLDFLKYYEREVAQTTMRDARSVFSRHLVGFFGLYQPLALSIALVNQYKNKRLDEGVKPKTINKELSLLSSLIKWAAREGHCQPLAFALPLYPQKRILAEPKHPLTRRQATAIYQAIEPAYRLIYLLMVDAGLRIREALQLRAEDINEHLRTITVLGKGSKYRIIPWTTARLEKELLATMDRRPSGFLSLNSQTGKPFFSIKKALIRAARQAGIERHVHHHLLRHTFLSLAAERGVDAHALQQLAGHASIETTNKIYTHVRQDYVRREVEKLRD
ncbi:MAG: tyrosine-type recombinase/integrase [Thermodesulfobacteriota bacterium]